MASYHLCPLSLTSFYVFVPPDDKQTSGILHISSVISTQADPNKLQSMATTILTFYTVSISDLYSRREDFVGDDDSDQGTVEEYMCTTDFAEQIMNEYDAIYSRAAYKALLNSQGKEFSIHIDDLWRVMAPLRFRPFTEVMIESGGEKFAQSLSVVVKEIPGEKYLYFFALQDETSPEWHEAASTSSSDGEDDEDEDSQSSDDESDAEMVNSNRLEPKAPHDINTSRPPVFIRFLLDGAHASLEDLKCFNRSARFTALVTVFENDQRSPSNFPLFHREPIGRIKGVLDAYVAEQTLERLRRHGGSIENADLGLARKCLRRARDVMTSEIALKFYSSASDGILSASEPLGGDYFIEEGRRLLQKELVTQKELEIRRLDVGKFIVLGEYTDTSLLPFWCFLDFDENGFVSVEVHHPSGLEGARYVLSSVHKLILRQNHRVNQIMILQRLHKNRVATTLMIERDDLLPNKEDGIPPTQVDHPCPFSCPVVFRKEFELFHRCATNPEQVARTVETSVLHIFSLSNRRSVFVYKDESGSIFYMRLSTRGGGLEPDGVIELIVHGIDEPSESLTKHLSRLISKKILGIAVDLLAAVLTKNPRYAWRPSDVQFVVEYNEKLREVEEIEKETESSTFFYSFPASVSDPSAILLYFRQNLCGSTYFHPLICSNSSDTDAMGGAPAFSFYYNNFPSKLSPKLQGRSTLTAKGAEFARMAGQGLALIDVSLVDSAGSLHSLLSPVAELCEITFPLTVSSESIQVQRLDNMLDVSRSGSTRLSSHFVKVKITDTSLRQAVLHDWIALTLNQVTSAWCIERHLERQQTGKFLKGPIDSVSLTKQADIEQHIPGLSALVDMYDITHSLPHPAVQKIAFDGVIRSSSVASVALSLFDLIVHSIRRETRGSVSVDHAKILRISRVGKPSLVKLSWSLDRRTCLVHPVSSGRESDSDLVRRVADSHTDCPHYLMFFASPEYTSGSETTKTAFPKLFEQVNVGNDYQKEERLVEIKKVMPNIFRRSFSFFLSVKRNSRFLVTYNWRSDLFTGVASKLKEEDASLLETARRTSDRLQKRSLGFLSPAASSELIRKRFAGQQSQASLPTPDITTVPRQTQVRSHGDTSKVETRKAVRPIAIRRPKLIGKSVDGSAVHAVQASRARASFKGSHGPPQSTGARGVASSSSMNSKALLVPRKGPEGRQRKDSRRALTPEEKKMNRVVHEFKARMTRDQLLIRRHSLLQNTTNAFLCALWPYKNDSVQITAAGEFLMSQTSLEFVSTVELLAFPMGMLDTFTNAFATYLCASLGGFHIVGTSKKDPSRPPIVFLGGEVRKMKGIQCFPVLQIEISRGPKSRRPLLLCSQWTVVLRRSFSNPIDFSYHCRSEKENRANGPDKLATVVWPTASAVESRLVEFACSEAMKGFEEKNAVLGLEFVKLMRDFEEHYDLSYQVYMLRSEYHVFSKQLILKSFRSPLIDHFASSALFHWLLDNSKNYGGLACGTKYVLLSDMVEVDGACALCVLSDVADRGTMKMSLLCRASVDILQYSFQPESYLAITVADQLAIKAAGLAYNALLAASTSLRLRSLWGLASHEAPRPHHENSKSIIEELLRLCTTEPFFPNLSNSAKDNYKELVEDTSYVQWSEVCDCMALEEAFSPSWTMVDDRRLFYMRAYDMFLLIALKQDNSSPCISFVLKSPQCSGDKGTVGAAQHLMNFLLHFLWHTVAAEP